MLRSVKAHIYRSINSLLLLLCCLAPITSNAQLIPELTVAIAEHQQAAIPPLLDRKLLLTESTLRSVQLSPDGQHVAFITRHGLENSLQLLNTTTLQTEQLLSSTQLTNIDWVANSSALILHLGKAIGVLRLDQRNAASYIATLDSKTHDRLLGSDRSSSGGVLIVREQAAGGWLLLRSDLNGTSTELLRSEDYIQDALLSADASTVFVATTTAEQRQILRLRAGQTTTLTTCQVLDSCRILVHDDATDALWLHAAQDSDLQALLAVNSTGEMQRLHSDPRQVADLATVSFSKSAPRIAQYHDSTLHNYGLDAATQATLDQLSARFAGSNLHITLSDDEQVWLLDEDRSDLAEARHYLLQRATGTVTEILTNTRNPALPAAAQLSRKLPIDYRASDGLLLHGYLTLPTGVALSQAPLVAVIHGGPWTRITSSANSYTQLLANRGYIVFEPNFRASTGYGQHYMTSANRDFGNGRVQQDITEGVQFLLNNNIGDRNRVAIAGTSFGGFSVLSGLAFTPELYKVGIAAVPPADMGSALRQLLSHPDAEHRDATAQAELTELLGDINNAADLERLFAQSPQASLATIDAPLLIVAGADDDRVSISHVKDYSLELLNLGKQVSLWIDEDEGHRFANRTSMAAYYYLTELMLATYLRGRMQPLNDEGVAHYIDRKLLLRAGLGWKSSTD
jgi:dipeptidyl aminopeptidase/acylaminoacyl peptidase